MANQKLGDFASVLASSIADPTLVKIPIIDFNQASPANQNATMVPAQFALLLAAMTSANNGLSSSSGVIGLGTTSAGSGSSNFTASRYVFTAGFNFQIGGTYNNSIFLLNGTSGELTFNNTWSFTDTRVIMQKTAPVTPNYGLLSLGGGAWNGSTSGYFGTSSSSSSLGTVLAINTTSAYTGDLANWQVGGAYKFKVGSNGTIQNAGDIQSSGVGTFSSGLASGGGSTNGFVNFNASNGNVITLITGATTASYTFTLPTSAGTSGFVLSTNGSGVTSWIAAGGSSALSSVTAATTSASIDNGSNTVTWQWNSITTGNGFVSSTSSVTTGFLASHTHSTSVIASGGSMFNISSTGANTSSTTGGLLNLSSTASATGTQFLQTYTGITTGFGQRILHTTSVIADGGSLFSVRSSGVNTAGSTTGSLVNFISTGSTSGVQFLQTYSALTTGVGQQIVGTALTTGDLLRLAHTTSVIANGGSMFEISSTGINTSTTTGSIANFTSTASTASTQFLQTYSGLTTGIGQQIVVNALSAGTAFEVVSTSTAPTVGTTYANTYKGIGVNLTGALATAGGKSYGIWVINAKTGGTNNFDSAAARFEGASEFKAGTSDGKILRFYNSSNTLLGEINHRAATSGLQFLSGGSTYMVTDNAGLVGFGSTTAPVGTVNIQTSSSATSGVSYNMYSTITFNPTSGTRALIMNYIAPTINQTGGANGITRGIFIDPTLTAASSFRALEISNNSQFAIYQTGASAQNYFNGAVGIGVITNAATAALQIDSTTKGFLPPRLTGAQAVTLAAASPAQALIIFVTSTSGSFTAIGWWGWDGTNWVQL